MQFTRIPYFEYSIAIDFVRFRIAAFEAQYAGDSGSGDKASSDELFIITP